MKFRFKWIYPALWALLIFILSTLPTSKLPKVGIEISDKIAHGAFYAVLSLLMIGALCQSTSWSFKKSAIWSFVATSIFGTAIEVIQGVFFKYRFFDVYDMMANEVGCLGGILIFLLLFKN